MQTLHITANSRLTTAIKHKAILATEQAVIHTPNAMTLPQWWQHWQTSALLAGELAGEVLPKKILNSFEAQWLWEQLLQEELDQRLQASEKALEQEDDSHTQAIALLNTHTTAKQLYQAWLLSAEWLAENGQDDYHPSNEVLLFQSVLQRYLNRLKSKGWQDDALLSQQRLTWLEQSDWAKKSLPKRFYLHGFDDLSPNIQRWKTTVESLGCEVQDDTSEATSQLQTPTDGMYCYAADDLFDEVEQVALWAVKQTAKQLQHKTFEQVNIAIVAPNIADYSGPLSQCLDEQLYIAGLGKLQSQPNLSASHKLYNVSLGESLFSIPLIENAWQTLELFFQPDKLAPYQNWSQWLISPYTLGDFTLRQQADAQFRRLQWANIHWPKLIETDAAQSLPKALKSAMQKWLSITTESPQKTVSLKTFIDQAWLLLATLAWPGSRSLNSDEYQQRTAFENSLTQFSQLADIGGKQSYAKWLGLFKRYLTEQVHQSQSIGHQPIQIMGMLEAGGQEFDAIWLMGLTNEAWPRMPNPNPFIPMHLQRQYKMPRSDASRELVYAQQISHRLVKSADTVIWSYPKQTGEAILLPSTILPQTSQASLRVSRYEPTRYQTLAELVLAMRDEQNGLQWELDAQGAEIAEASQAPGGTGILQAQSQCPLMAYIDYRLGAKYGLKTVEDSLQNTNQGTLIHEVLEHFWLEVKTQVSLLTLSEQALIEKLTTHISKAFESLQDSLAQGILAVEQKRILELCLQWLALESERSAFEVVETESEHLIRLAGIDFKVIIDRVDKVDGQAVILDYKTGKASINQLLQTPLAAPQLAVYLLGVSENVGGIGYALLHSDDGAKLSAVVEDDDVFALPKFRSIQVFSKLSEKEGGDYYETTWLDFLDHLKQQVIELASQIQQGKAQMTFAKLSDIQYAEGHLALRVPEVLQQHQAYENSFSQNLQETE